MSRILIAEDEAISGIAVRQQLERAGYRIVAVVGSGEEVIERVEQEPPDLVLMDGVLAGELDGVDTARVLRERFDVPVVYITGRSDQEFVQRAKTTRPLGYIAKPFAGTELLAVVELALSTLQRTGEVREGFGRELRVWFGLLFDLSRDATFLLTDQGVILDMNSAVREVLGYSREDLIGATVDKVFDAAARFASIKEGLKAKDETETLSMHCGHVCKDGSVFKGEVVFRQVSYADQRFIAATSRGCCSDERARYLADHDVLTGLLNRRGLGERLQQALGAARRRGGSLGLLYLDLDGFKAVNDDLGHAAGDRLLQDVGVRLRAALRAETVVGRHGGDEFVVLLPELAGAWEAARVAERLLQALARPYRLEGRELRLGASIGIGLYPEDAPDAEGLLRRADAAMYQAKRSGRNHYRFAGAEANAQHCERAALERQLRAGMDRGELALVYQPQVGLADGQVRGLEALLRWERTDGVVWLPGQFMSLAEESGLSVTIGEWVLGEVARQQQMWQAQGLGAVPVAVNLSARQLYHAGLAELLREQAVRGGPLVLEIGEAILQQEPTRAAHALGRLRAQGLGVMLDGFGSAAASVTNLLRLPLDGLKLDPAWMRQAVREAPMGALVAGVIRLAQARGLTVVGMGVERSAEARWLRRHGCALAQGHYYTPPLPAKAAGLWLQRQRTRGEGLAARGARA